MAAADQHFQAARRAFAEGDLAGAESHCLQALQAAPKDSRPWGLLSETALRRNRPDAAIVCADKAVRFGPRDPFAHLMRAKCLALDGKVRDALDSVEAGLRTGPADAAALDGYGAVLSMLGQHRRALDLFGKAVAADRGQPQFLLNLAAAERMMGDLDFAETHCDQAIARDPHFYLAHYIRADLREQRAARNHIAEMEALVAAGTRHPAGEVLLRFALGKECEDLGEHARAFSHIKAGAALHRRNLRYEVEGDIGLIDRIIRAQTEEVMAALPPGYPGEAPIFVLGLPRSGTTLVERIIAGHSAVAPAGELGILPTLLRQAGADSAWIEGLGALDPADLGRRYVEAAHAFGLPPDRRFIDKFPGNYLHCGAIHAALPAAKIVLLRRRPMDSCFALFKAHFAGTYPFSYALDELGAYFLAFRRLAEHWKAVLPADTLLEIAYEDIVTDFAATSRRLLDFLGLPWEDEVLRFHASTAPSTTASAVQVRRPLYTSSIGKWRHHEAELAPLKAQLATALPESELE
jgi:tetratricopeptide (TPR) repeat protein